MAYCRAALPSAHDERPGVLSLRTRFRDRLKENPYPLFCFAEGIIPAASVWTGSRLWVNAFREAGLTAGDRLLITLDPSAAWLQVVVAAIWEGLTLALAPAATTEQELDDLMNLIDARAGVLGGRVTGSSTDTGDSADTGGSADSPVAGHPSVFDADWCSGPLSSPLHLREAAYPPTPEVRFLLRTSGTTGSGRWIGLSEENVVSVVDAHLPHLGFQEAESCVLSVLPWHHCFGLVIDLLPALLSGCEIHRSSDGGRDPSALIRDFSDIGVTQLSAVPLTIRRLARTEGGESFLHSLLGGVIGGAPIDAETAAILKTTNLRVGYGQTEASPGICLGEPGRFPFPELHRQAAWLRGPN